MLQPCWPSKSMSRNRSSSEEFCEVLDGLSYATFPEVEQPPSSTPSLPGRGPTRAEIRALFKFVTNKSFSSAVDVSPLFRGVAVGLMGWIGPLNGGAKFSPNIVSTSYRLHSINAIFKTPAIRGLTLC